VLIGGVPCHMSVTKATSALVHFIGAVTKMAHPHHTVLLVVAMLYLTAPAVIHAQPGYSGGSEHEEASFDADSAVITLTSENFSERMRALPKVVIVDFYAPCMHARSGMYSVRDVAELHVMHQSGREMLL